jgi:nitrogen-specific signal transduction histidine kinase
LEKYIPNPETIVELKELSETLKNMEVENKAKASFEARAKAARQVVHDIRSPLACLVLLLSNAINLPEEQRTLMRASIQRITDIVNSLYSDAQKISPLAVVKTDNVDNLMIAFLVDELVSEKRVQVSDKKNIQINFDLSNAYGLFSRINSTELKRALSNIINNSFEAFDQHPHSINIALSKFENKICIRIQDDGIGIPASIIHKAGQYGFTYGKEKIEASGTGLGLFHAIKTLESFGGMLTVTSKENQGTIVTITLNQAPAPSWFIEKIDLTNVDRIIVLDDDQSIHKLWGDKCHRDTAKELDIFYFYCCNEFRKYFFSLNTALQNTTLFLIDFELLHHGCSGLDLIEELHLAKQAIFVTSHYEDISIRKIAEKLGLKIIPKRIVAFVPIC